MVVGNPARPLKNNYGTVMIWFTENQKESSHDISLDEGTDDFIYSLLKKAAKRIFNQNYYFVF